MGLLFTFLLSSILGASTLLEIDGGTLAMPAGKVLSLGLPPLHDKLKNIDSIYIECFINPQVALRFNKNVKCGTAMAFARHELPAYLSALAVQLHELPQSAQLIEIRIFLFDHGNKIGVYKVQLQPLNAIPIQALGTKARLQAGTETAVLRVDALWPQEQVPRVVLNGTGASKVITVFKNRVVYAKMEAGAKFTDADLLQISLIDDRTGLVSASVALAPPSKNWGRLWHSVCAAVAALVSAVTALLISRRKKAVSGTQRSIEDWNNSFAGRSVTSIKTDDESFSTVVSMFDDAQLSRRAHSGILLSPSVEVLDLPFDLRVSL